MDEVQVATLDRRLRLELPAAPARLGEDLCAVLDHAERPSRALQLFHDRLADLRGGRRPLECACLIGVALDRIGGRLDRRRDGVGGELTAPHGVDPSDGAFERLVDPGRQVADRGSEMLHLAGPRHDPPRPTQDREDAKRQCDECRDRQEDRELEEAHLALSAQPERARSSASNALPTSTRSPMTIMSAKSAMGASGSRLTAMIVEAVCMPTLCWIAPLMPIAR